MALVALELEWGEDQNYSESVYQPVLNLSYPMLSINFDWDIVEVWLVSFLLVGISTD